MIVFDLRCGADHVFEAWFGTGADYDDQSRRKLIACPLCGSDEIAKAASAPAIPAKSNRAGVSAPQAKALLATIAAAQQQALSGSDYVGDRFASEARAIHLGEAEARSIHGQATRGDARALIEEGVPIAALPMPVIPPRERN